MQWRHFGFGLPVIPSAYATFVMMPLPINSFLSIFDARMQGHAMKDVLASRDGELPGIAVVVAAEVVESFYGSYRLSKSVETSPQQDAIDQALSDTAERCHTRVRSMHYCRSARYNLRNNATQSVSLDDCLRLFQQKGNMDPKSLWSLSLRGLTVGSVRTARRTCWRRARRGSGARQGT